MKEDRIPVKKINKWDKSLRQNCWVEQVKQILQHCNMYECMTNNVPCDLEVLEARFKVLNRNRWWLEANDKPKLRTYIQIHDNEIRQPRTYHGHTGELLPSLSVESSLS